MNIYYIVSELEIILQISIYKSSSSIQIEEVKAENLLRDLLPTFDVPPDCNNYNQSGNNHGHNNDGTHTQQQQQQQLWPTNKHALRCAMRRIRNEANFFLIWIQIESKQDAYRVESVLRVDTVERSPGGASR